MRIRILTTLCAALTGAVNAFSAIISPNVRELTQTDSVAFCGRCADFELVGDGQADPQAVAALRKALPVKQGGKIKIYIGEAGDSAVASVSAKIPEQPEGYYLSTVPGRVVIAGRDGNATFYGVQSFLQLAKGKVPALEIRDWPEITLRGVIEGFYGNPWSHTDRLRQFDFYGANKLNIYIYGPKDDPYHHSRWYEPYPADKAREMAELVKHAAQNKVIFTWAMHPSNSIETDADRQKALEKFQRMYDLGVRSFAIFFDDISAKSVDSQISYLNFLDKNFVKKHPGVRPLVVCPTQYNKAWSGGDYLSKMGSGLNPDIEIMWTGNTVCDMIGNDDCQWFTAQTGRKPFIWLNYPVNDYGMHNLLMGPVTGNEAGIGNKVAAFCSNPMQYAEASKVALYQLADFAWNPTVYNADRSWEQAVKHLMPAHPDAFRTFCLNNIDVAPSVHGLRFYGETPDFAALVDARSPQLCDSSLTAFESFFNAQREAANELLPSSSGADPLLTEVREWIVALQIQGNQGLAVIDMSRALADGNGPAFIAAYKTYKELAEEAENIVSRDFPGSIQSVRVQTGTLHVAPWLKNRVGELIDVFKASGMDYPADLFPRQVLENGTFYIKHSGKWLGNPQAGAAGGNPVWQSAIDDVNPNRQEWHIKLDPVTGRYSIRNSKDERYVNEIGNFGTNPYSADWNTYVITEKDGRYAIQNAGNGGQGFWQADGDRISTNAMTPQYVFEITPVHQ